MKYNKINLNWTGKLAYIVGIIATDGNLSPDLRHVVITSKDEQLLLDIKVALKLTSKIGKKSNGKSKEKKYFVLQIGDKRFYNFLYSIGLTRRKSLTIKRVNVPKKYFSHFLRGCLDGDGNIDLFSHKESKNIQLRIRLASASFDFLTWLHETMISSYEVKGGWIYSQKNKTWHVLTYGKADSLILLHHIYKRKNIFLDRKYQKVVSLL